jgi:hypothetical protein
MVIYIMPKNKHSKKSVITLKGVAPLVSSILIIGVLAGITGIAYQWGMPMMQKNVGKTELYSAETLLKNLDKKIDDVARNGGREEVLFNLPGEIKVYDADNRIEFILETSGSIYAPGGFICFSRNCDLDEGIWGEDSYTVLGAQVLQSDRKYAQTKYILLFRELISDSATYTRDIVTTEGGTLTGSKGNKIVISKIGEERGDTIKTIIKIDLI